MKNKIITFIIGALTGAIITATIFLLVKPNNSKKNLDFQKDNRSGEKQRFNKDSQENENSKVNDDIQDKDLNNESQD